MNKMALCTFPIIGIYCAIHLSSFDGWNIIYLSDITYILSAIFVLFFHANHQFKRAKEALGIGFIIAFSLTAFITGSQNNVVFFLLIASIGTTILFNKSPKTKYFFFALSIFILIALKIYFISHPLGYGGIAYPIRLNIINSVLIFLLTFIIVNRTSTNREEFYKQLIKRNQEVTELNALLEQKVEERTAIIIAKSKALEATNEELKRFAYISSHDLREPLRNMMGFIQLIQRDIKIKNYQRLEEYSSFIYWGVNRLDHLTKDVALYTEIEQKLKFTTTINCNLLVKSLVEDLTQKAREDSCRISFDRLPMIKANSTLLYYLFHSLMSNAMKYCDKQQLRLVIDCQEQQEVMKFSISDNGPGIAPSFHRKIFTLFKRLHNDLENAGSGIGLSVCKKIVEGYGGKIWVENNELEGAVFYFTLPNGMKLERPITKPLKKVAILSKKY